MTVSHYLRTQCGIARLRTIILRESDKELLVAGEPLLLRSWLAAERRAIAVIRGRDAGNVGDIFRQGLLAVDGQIGERFVRVILRGQLRRRGVKMLQIGFSPPVAHASFCVKS